MDHNFNFVFTPKLHKATHKKLMDEILKENISPPIISKFLILPIFLFFHYLTLTTGSHLHILQKEAFWKDNLLKNTQNYHGLYENLHFLPLSASINHTQVNSTCDSSCLSFPRRVSLSGHQVNRARSQVST